MKIIQRAYKMGFGKNHDFVVEASRDLPTALKKGEEIKSDAASNVDSKQATGRLKVARANSQKHWRRFWCCYVVPAIIFLAILLPVL
jgi:hypothetical protein